MSEELVLTHDDVKRIKEQIKELEEKIIPRINKELKEAIEDGDLRENAPFDIAKQKFAEAREKLNQLKEMLKKAKIVDNTFKSTEKTVKMGSTVKLLMGNQEKLITIVSDFEANPLENKFSTNSPLGKALIGKKVGDKIHLNTPSGSIIEAIINDILN